MNQSNVFKWLKILYRLGILGVIALLIILSLALGIMLIDDLNVASIIIIILVAILMAFLFKKIH